MMRILERKGFVSHRKNGRAFVFEALVDESRAQKNAIRHVLASFLRQFAGYPGAQPPGARGRTRRRSAAVARADSAPRMEMTVVWAFTWLGQSAALAALTAVFVRLPGCRQSAAARHVAWRLTLFLCAGLLAWWLVPGGASPFPPVPVVAGARPPVSIALIMLAGRGHTTVLVVRLGLGPGRGRSTGARCARCVARRSPETADRSALIGGAGAVGSGAGRVDVGQGSTPGLVRPTRLSGGSGILPSCDCLAAPAGVVPLGRAVSIGRAPRTGTCPPRR